MIQGPNYAGQFEQFLAENLLASLLFFLACALATGWFMVWIGDRLFGKPKKKR